MGKLTDFLRRGKKAEEKEIRYILSIDGGGMRGIIPAHILRRISEALKAEGDERPLYSHFDLIAGTSTGALLAAGLSCPASFCSLKPDSGDEPAVLHEEKPSGLFRRGRMVLDGYIERAADPESLESIYLEQGGRIFSRSLSTLAIFGPIFQDKYDVRNLEKLLAETFGNTGLDELMTPTAIVSFETKSSRPYIFRSYDSHGFLIREAARASTAAPLYFPPARLTDRATGEQIVCIDGGIGANNPAFIAYAEASRLYPDADEYRILSLSTCKNPYSFDPSKSNGGAASWAGSITRVYMSAQDSAMDMFASGMKDLRYTRIHSQILDRRIPLDDTSKESIRILMEGAETAFSNQKEEILSFVRELAGSRTASRVRLKRKDIPLLSPAGESARS